MRIMRIAREEMPQSTWFSVLVCRRHVHSFRQQGYARIRMPPLMQAPKTAAVEGQLTTKPLWILLTDRMRTSVLLDALSVA